MARRKRLLGSLGARFVLVTFAVALIAVLVTALVAVQVVQTVEQNQARQQLKAQAAALVASGRGAGGRVGVVGDRFAVVSPDGTVTGAARATVGAEVVRKLQHGESVSAATTLNGKDAVLVGIPGPNGGGIVGVRKVSDIAAGDAELLRGILLALAIGLTVATPRRECCSRGCWPARFAGWPMSRKRWPEAGAGSRSNPSRSRRSTTSPRRCARSTGRLRRARTASESFFSRSRTRSARR